MNVSDATQNRIMGDFNPNISDLFFKIILKQSYADVEAVCFQVQMDLSLCHLSELFFPNNSQ
jgi:hypothetical protein